jgi:chromosome segregation ATPase
MYAGIGFLAATLIALVVAPLIHGRATRLVRRKLDASTPATMTAMKADKDQLRAEFSMATRRLELTIDRLKARSIEQGAELGHKLDAIARLKEELGEKVAANFALEARDKALRDQLRAAEQEIAVKTNTLYDALRDHADMTAEFTALKTNFEKTSRLADAQHSELTALKTQLASIKARDALLLSVMTSSIAGDTGESAGNGNGGHLPDGDNGAGLVPAKLQ